MDKQTAIKTAARQLLEHGGPSHRTDPHTPLDAMREALTAGASRDDIAAEMIRQHVT